MPGIVRQYQGGDLVIPKELLAQLGVEPGQYLVVRPMAPLPLLELRVAPEAPAWPTVAWTDDVGEELDAECTHEAAWLFWAGQAG